MSIDISINEKNASRIIERGIVNAVWRICAWYGLALLICLIVGYLITKGDTTDGSTRSNMSLHTDAMTGCQYLSVVGGGITPRLSADGKQICSEVAP